MATYAVMPKLGMTMESGVVTKWLKQEGEQVKKGEPLFELETDKLDTQAECPADGVLLKILVPEGTEVAILKEVAVVGQAGEDISALLGAGAEQPAAPAAPEQTAAPEQAQASRPRADGRIVASPRARAVARELGVDLAQVSPTGPNGRIVERDVRAFRPQAPVKASPLAARAAEELGLDLSAIEKDGRIMVADLVDYLKARGGWAAPAGQPQGGEERRPMNGMRRAIAQNMQASHMTSPTVTYHVSVDMSQMKQYRAQLAAGGLKVSYTDLLVKFVAKALTQFPLLNCSVEEGEIVYKHYVNMGVAVALEDGLVVPNIPDADKKGLEEISRELKEVSQAAREGRLPMDRMRGGTFTITNLGMYGIESFSPIINQPEVAILGVNAMEDRVVVREGQQVVRPMMGLSLTADHRAVDGAVAAQFLHRVKQLLEQPALLLA